MVVLKTAAELSAMRDAGRISAQALLVGGEAVKPGVTTAEIDRKIHKFILSQGAKPSFLGYGGFPGSACISVNDEVIHGIPGSRVIREGDIVSIDVGAYYKGYHGDNAFTFTVGSIAPDVQQLLDATQEGLRRGIAAAVPGNRIGDIGWAVQSYVEQFGFGVVKEYVGHGVGQNLHEDPEVPNYGRPGHGTRLVPGMVIAIEPMINMGARYVVFERDGWTVRTRDRKPSAHFEFAVAVGKEGPDVLTDFGVIEQAINS